MARPKNADTEFNKSKKLKATKKTTKKTVRKKEEKIREVVFPDGTLINPCELDTMGENLTIAQRLFIIWYTYPDSDAFFDKFKAAMKAGFSKEQASITGYRYLKNEKMAKIIKNVTENLTTSTLEESFRKIIYEKTKRINFDIGDFYEVKEKTLKDESTIMVEVAKDLCKLTPEQRKLIDGVDYKTNHGLRVYVLPDRRNEMNDLLNLHSKICNNKDTLKEGFDVESTAEIIGNKLKLATKIIKRNDEISKIADGFVDASNDLIVEE